MEAECPPTPLAGAPGFLARVRAAIADQDQATALQLLRQLAEGAVGSDTKAGTLNPLVGDALVATARGAQQDAADRAALARHTVVEQRRDQVIELLERTPFTSADLAVIREVVVGLEASARHAEEQVLREEVVGGDTAAKRRVGSVWLELKYIPDAASGKRFGPYLYGRWREGRRKRSKYIGKVT
jgi:hypothetical protein